MRRGRQQAFPASTITVQSVCEKRQTDNTLYKQFSYHGLVLLLDTDETSFTDIDEQTGNDSNSSEQTQSHDKDSSGNLLKIL